MDRNVGSKEHPSQSKEIEACYIKALLQNASRFWSPELSKAAIDFIGRRTVENMKGKIQEKICVCFSFESVCPGVANANLPI